MLLGGSGFGLQQQQDRIGRRVGPVGERGEHRLRDPCVRRQILDDRPAVRVAALGG